MLNTVRGKDFVIGNESIGEDSDSDGSGVRRIEGRVQRSGGGIGR